MQGKIVYSVIFPEPGSLGKERSDDVRKWLEEFLIPAGIATLYEDEANAYLVATGDGGLIRAIREKHNKGKIFVGANRGTLGFLLNPIQKIKDIPLDFNELQLVDLDLIQVTFILKDGSKVGPFLVFNDVMCGTKPAGWIKFTIQGSLSYYPNRTCWGNCVFVSTPQGATGLALKARGTGAVLPLDSKTWFVGGFAIGPYPCDIVQPQKITIEVESREDPIYANADGRAREVENVAKVIVEPTDKSVTLGFLKSIDFAARRTQLAQKTERGE
ncbi:MAG: hypothetical protein WC242_03715 [Candidatus Paceibacterota bacterium]|jgi:NAD+ kinase